MLLYVDKKELRHRKIKLISIILSCFLILLANFICFKTTLHQTNKSLTTYKPLQITQDWYNKAGVVTLFSEKKSKQIKAIIIPQTLNRENVLTIALAFSKFADSNPNLVFADDISEQEYLQQLGALFTQSAAQTPSNNIVITTDLNNLIPLINKQKLYPHTINYAQTAKLQHLSSLQKLLNQKFPPACQPQTAQEQQLQAIKTFANTHHADLQSLIHSSSRSIAFTTRNLILQNLGVCLSTASKTSCCAEQNKSLQHNIHTALAGLSHHSPQKLFLLTTPEKLSSHTTLDTDDGVFLRYGNDETFILPQKRKQLANNTDIYAYLKQQAGLNPDYNTPDMKFYKFKTTEININDNI